MSLSVRESGITFGPFDEARFYHVEKSGSYNRLGKNFSTVEFIFMNLELSSQVQHQAKENFRGRFPAKTLSWAKI